MEKSVSRVPLPVVQETPDPVECTECGKCCTYVGVEVETPEGAKDASDILWYLYHPGVYIYIDGNEDWSVHFESRCDNLGDDLLCRIYEQRPDICRGFDNTTCEVNDHGNEATTIRTPAEFLDWLRDNEKKGFRKIYKKLQKRYLPPTLRPADPRPGRSKKGKKDKKGKKNRKS
jgi:Fe-S-cluster containining protein